ncbi:MAG: hypothetical protein ACK5JT_02845 [Hyphomicrobiaceae bacterium]
MHAGRRQFEDTHVVMCARHGRRIAGGRRGVHAVRHRGVVWAIVIVFGLGLSTVWRSDPALALGTVAMPYACQVDGDQVSLLPSTPRSYRLLGPHDQQTITACGLRHGQAMEDCQSLPIYRFRFVCGGQAVDWLAAVAATWSGKPWRFEFGDGRMTIRGGANARGPRDLRSQDLHLPVGFAPSPGPPLSFAVADQASTSAASSAVARAVPLPVRCVALTREPPAGSSIGSSPLARIGDGVGKSAEAGAPTSPMPTDEKPDAVHGQPLHAIAGAGRANTTLDDGDRMADGPPSLAVPVLNSMAATSWYRALRPPNPMWLTLLFFAAAVLLSAYSQASRQRLISRVREVPSIEGGKGSESDEPSDIPPPPKPSVKMRPDGEMAAEGAVDGAMAAAERTGEEGPTIGSNLVAPGGDGRAVLDFDELQKSRATAEALQAVVGQILADHIPEGRLRDLLIVEVKAVEATLSGTELAGALQAGWIEFAVRTYAQAIVDLERIRALALIEQERVMAASEPAPLTPGDYLSACAFLGVNPTADDAVIKKVVMALRQNWHPDHAINPTDRDAREVRIKQINAAWDAIRAR